MKVEEIMKTIKPEIMLRKPSPKVVAEYAELMKNGVVFPPVIIGLNKKENQKILVDGHTRVKAAQAAGLDTLAVTEVEYASPDLLLLDAYKLNLHGAKVSTGDRDNRIRLLAAAPFKWTQERIGKEFGLTQESISRIIRGKQKEKGGASGEAEGGKDAKQEKAFKALTGKGVLSTAEKLERSLRNKSTRGDLIELCWIREDGSKKDIKKAAGNLDILKELKDSLVGFFNALEKEKKSQ